MKNRGFALILVLIIVATCVGAVLSIMEWASKNCEWTEKLYSSNLANIYIRTALNTAKELLKEDKNSFDSPKDLWAIISSIPVKKGQINLSIVPTNKKINLNMLFSERRGVRTRIKNAVSIILTQDGVNPDMTLDAINVWVKNTDFVPLNYMEHIPPYLPRRHLFYSLKEVDFVQGLTDFSAKYHKYFTVNGESKININFASPEVLKAYLPELDFLVDDLIAWREEHYFKNITQIRNLPGITDDIYLKVQPFITTKSTVFIVKVNVNIDSNNYFATALMSKISNRVKLIKYFEGNGFYE